MSDDPHKPAALNPTGKDGQVEIVQPPEEAMHMTAEEADISAIRLMDAAKDARDDRAQPKGKPK